MSRAPALQASQVVAMARPTRVDDISAAKWALSSPTVASLDGSAPLWSAEQVAGGVADHLRPAASAPPLSSGDDIRVRKRKIELRRPRRPHVRPEQ